MLEPDTDEGGWDAEPVADGAPADLDEQAYAGYLPFVDDEDDDSNQGIGGLPRALLATPGLRLLFQETFGAGRTQPHRRPTMVFWALELAKAFDNSLECRECKMSYFADDNTEMPYCAALAPRVHPRQNPALGSLDSRRRDGVCVPAPPVSPVFV